MISRRAVITGAGGALALGIGGTALSMRMSADRYADYAAKLRSPLETNAGPVGLVRYATLAANGHNTQPWRFRIGADSISILPDFSRRTPVVDPDDHHLYVSLGCALENLALAGNVGGWPGSVELRDGGVGGGAFVFAEGGAAPEDDFRASMFAAIPLRQSTRSVYAGTPISPTDLERLRAAATVDGVGLSLLTERSAIGAVGDLVIAGNGEQMDDPAFRRELKEWIRFSPQSAMTSGDGLYAASSGNPALPEWLGAIAFGLAFTKDSENDKYARQMDSSAGVAVLLAEEETPAGWIAVGRACQRFCLMAAAIGVKVAFVNQPVEVAALRPQLAAVSGFSGRRPDIALRFGYADALPFSPRRPVATVVMD